jgi:hypothetical protein
MHPMTQKKQELKEMAKEIRELKNSRKGGKTAEELSNINYKIWRLKREYRHSHIAYCLVRGRTYEQIETPREGNKPDFHLIETYYNKLKLAVEAANAEWRANVYAQIEIANG